VYDGINMTAERTCFSGSPRQHIPTGMLSTGPSVFVSFSSGWEGHTRGFEATVGITDAENPCVGNPQLLTGTPGGGSFYKMGTLPDRCAWLIRAGARDLVEMTENWSAVGPELLVHDGPTTSTPLLSSELLHYHSVYRSTGHSMLIVMNSKSVLNFTYVTFPAPPPPPPPPPLPPPPPPPPPPSRPPSPLMEMDDPVDPPTPAASESSQPKRPWLNPVYVVAGAVITFALVGLLAAGACVLYKRRCARTYAHVQDEPESDDHDGDDIVDGDGCEIELVAMDNNAEDGSDIELNSVVDQINVEPDNAL
jgi:hypothetical protein